MDKPDDRKSPDRETNSFNKGDNNIEESEDTMVEVDDENSKTDNWDSGSYSEAMKKFRETCLQNKELEREKFEKIADTYAGGKDSDKFGKFANTYAGNKDSEKFGKFSEFTVKKEFEKHNRIMSDRLTMGSDDEKENENNPGDNVNRDIEVKGLTKDKTSVVKDLKDSDREERGPVVPGSKVNNIKNDGEKDTNVRNYFENHAERFADYHYSKYVKDYNNGEPDKYEDRYRPGASMEMMQDQLTEQNVQLFTKMQYFSQNTDLSKAYGNANHQDFRAYKHPESKSNFESDCQSAEGSLDEAQDGKNDSENDLTDLKSGNQRLKKALLDSKSDMMRFAEVLYKCTLCTSIPSILTSKSNFMKHVTENHMMVDSQFKVCKICFLKFRTEEDLRRHIVCIHTGNDRLSPLETGSDVIRSELFCSSAVDNESDSDSSGHRSYKAKVVKRSKPHIPDFENPKQLVDHAGIETLNGSLDLSKKDGKSTTDRSDQANSNVYNNVPRDRSSPRSLSEKSALNVQQITDQIIKSNLHGRNISSQGEARVPLTPSYTPEFGKYTKLVREGGSIVYFCQVCNWMSPVKAHFQAHCGSLAHSKKVKATNEQEHNDMKADLSVIKDHGGGPCKSPSASMGNYDGKYGAGVPVSHPNILNVPSTSSFSKFHESNMYYNYIRPRNMTHCTRTPVVSGHGFQERSELMYRKQLENSGVSLNIPYRKRKKPSPSKPPATHTPGRQSNSDSDSEENDATTETDRDFQNSSRCSNVSMSLLRNKLLQGQGKNELKPGIPQSDCFSKDMNDIKPCLDGKFDTNSGTSMKNGCKMDLGSNDSSSTKKRKRTNDENQEISDLPEKQRKENTEDAEYNDSDQTLFKLYRCMSCPFEYSNLEEYEHHFSKVHIGQGQGQGEDQGSPQATFQRLFTNIGSGLTSQGHGHTEGQGNRNSELNAGSSSMEMGENWRVQRLKEILPDFLEVNDKGNTSRDYLLQCISMSAGIPDAPLWSSACNKAVREVFPSSLAQRKGKYKKYYFGLSMLESFQGQEDFTSLEADGQLYQPIRDINADMEKIMEQLPSIIHWNGCMDTGVYRADILSVLSDILEEQDVLNWGTQCNRAIKLVFPMVDMKRKGKFKTTKYFGVSFNQNIGQMPAKPDCNSNVADLSNTKEPRSFKPEENEDSSSREATVTLPETKNNNSAADLNREAANMEKAGKLVPVFPQWFKEEAESQMEQYLTKFGGVFDESNPKSRKKNEDEDNDGDDEGESIDDTSAC